MLCYLLISIAICLLQQTAVFMADALYGTGQGLDVEAAGLANRYPAYMNTRFLTGGHDRFYPIPGLESLHLLLTHQVAGAAISALI